MVNCCVNPACTAEYKLLRIGDVYAIERADAETEYVWLCSVCVADFDVDLDAKSAVLVKSRTEKAEPMPTTSLVKIYLVEHGARGVPLQRPVSASIHPAIEPTGDWGSHAHGANV